MRLFEIVRRDTNIIRVTVAKDRTTVKLPTYLSEEDEQTIVGFVKRIEDDVRSKFDKTMRGQVYYDFEKKWDHLVLLSDNKKDKVEYKI